MASVMTACRPSPPRRAQSQPRAGRVLTLAEVLAAGYRTARWCRADPQPGGQPRAGFRRVHRVPGPWTAALSAPVLTSLVKRSAPRRRRRGHGGLAAGWLRAHREGDFFLWCTSSIRTPLTDRARYLRARAAAGAKCASRVGTRTHPLRHWVPSPPSARGPPLYWARCATSTPPGAASPPSCGDGDVRRRPDRRTSDHGEEFWSTAPTATPHSLHELLHVPLLVKLPGAGRRGRRHAVSTASVAPTILGVAGCSSPRAIRPRPPPPRNERGQAGPLFSLGLNRFEDRRAVRFEHWKYVRWT